MEDICKRLKVEHPSEERGRNCCSCRARTSHCTRAARSARGARCLGMVQRQGRCSQHAVASRIHRGLAKSLVGIVLVTPALLDRLRGEGIADKELPASPAAVMREFTNSPIAHNDRLAPIVLWRSRLRKMFPFGKRGRGRPLLHNASLHNCVS